MDGGTPLCVVCGADLPQPSKRRILYPSGVANEDAGRFFLKFVVNVPRGEIYQDGSRPQYTCKPCFAKLERGSRQYSTTVSLISELRIAVRAAGRPIAVSVSDPFSPVARDSRGTQTDSGKPQEARKRPRGVMMWTPLPKGLDLLQMEEGDSKVCSSSTTQWE